MYWVYLVLLYLFGLVWFGLLEAKGIKGMHDLFIDTFMFYIIEIDLYCRAVPVMAFSTGSLSILEAP